MFKTNKIYTNSEIKDVKNSFDTTNMQIKEGASVYC